MKIISIAILVLLIYVATSAVFFSANLLWMACGVFVYGQALMWLAVHQELHRLRAFLRLSIARAMRLSLGLYVAAGALAAIGAVITLHPVFAAFVVWGASGWMWLNGYALKLTWNEPEPSLPADGS